MAMSKKLYNLMDWAEIEAVTYAEEDHPRAVLGAHPVRGGMTLVTAFVPDAKSVNLKIKRAKSPVKMELADEEGYFAVLVANKYPFEYTFEVTRENGTVYEYADPYSFDGIINKRDTTKFGAGIHYRAYDILGAKLTEVNGVKGVHFAVWAPNAVRVSVVGDFNEWDGRMFQMERLWDSGIFELFIPGVKEGSLYKYEIKMHNGRKVMKSDPYAYETELRPGTAAVVCDIDSYAWKDDDWIEKRGKLQNHSSAISIYEFSLELLKNSNYREMAPVIADYVKDMGYTHVELMPVMEYLNDDSHGFQTTSFFAATSRYGSPEDLMFFIDYMHKNDIGVILDWSPSKFPDDDQGLKEFDGTCLYEDQDPKRSRYPEWGNLYFNLGRPEVKNFLIADALFWVIKYHADGLRLDAVDKMLYLDYGKNDGEWIPNIYGGRENLDSVEFFKHLNSVFRKLSDDVMLIAKEDSAWSNVTGNVDEDGLGFDYKWNDAWTGDVLGYMQYDPLFRSNHYNEVCFPMIYQYSEKFILPLSHYIELNGRNRLYDIMPGDSEEKYANLRSLLSYYMFHPGKKLLFGCQDLSGKFRSFMKDLLKLYRTENALHAIDDSPEGFEWINNISANENIVVFVRKSSQKGDILIAVANFENVPRKDYKIGVPAQGQYTEIFNSDAEKYDGFGFVNDKPVRSEKDECDGREDSIRIKVAPMAVSLFRYSEE